MPTFAVDVKVGEIVDGFETVLEEIKSRYFAHVVLGLLALLTGVLITSCCGSLCGLFCYHKVCRRLCLRKREKSKRTAV